jgi:glutamine amidotransferase
MLALIDSGLANLFSVEAALARLGVEVARTDDAATIRRADRVILPGVGAAGPAMEGLRTKGLVDVIRGLNVPTLGICLGLQLMFEASDEGEGAIGLGLLPGRVERLPNGPEGPIPHMGWNDLTFDAPEHPLLRGLTPGCFVYFVHSFAVAPNDATVATCRYTAPFTAIAARGNFMGCQFHPERSGAVGSHVLRNFMEL